MKVPQKQSIMDVINEQNGQLVLDWNSIEIKDFSESLLKQIIDFIQKQYEWLCSNE